MNMENRLSLRNNQLKFKTPRILLIFVEESMEYTSNSLKRNQTMSTCSWLDLETLGFRPVMSKNLRSHCKHGLLSTPSVPKWLSYFLDLLVPKWLSGWYAQLEIWGSNIFTPNFLYQEVFQHCNFQGRFKVVDALCFKSHTYTYATNGQWALISPKLETRTIILEGREYFIGP